MVIQHKPSDLSPGSDVDGVLLLLFRIAQNPSLFVSIPALHCWTRLLRSRTIRGSDIVSQMASQILTLCCARLVRYESFPEDSDNVTVLFLNEDIDTVPERHTFLGNYRRYCIEIIETLVRTMPVEAMTLLLNQSTVAFQSLYEDQPPFQGVSRVADDLASADFF